MTVSDRIEAGNGPVFPLFFLFFKSLLRYIGIPMLKRTIPLVIPLVLLSCAEKSRFELLTP